MAEGRRRDVLRAIRRGRAIARFHDTAGRAEIEARQAQRLRALVAHARAHSPFHAERLRGIDVDAPDLLRRLPTMDKAAMMADLPRVLTDPRLRQIDLDAHVERLTGDELLLGSYRVMATGGTSGVRGLFVWGREAWVELMGGMAACAVWFGMPPRIPRVRMATIWAAGPAHMSARIAASFRSPAYRRLQLSAMAPIPELVEQLNAFRPDWLSTYPSIGALLAEEQLAGRLDIAPHVVMATSEQCTPGMRRRIQEAWGTQPFDVYACTEASGVALECDAHSGLHVMEELVILEVEPDGRVLLTNLYNPVQPLIRYEMTDLLAFVDEPCACGRSSKRIAAIEGRTDDVIRLPDATGREVPVHPNHFCEAVESVAGVHAYQVREEERGIEIDVVAPGRDAEDVCAAIRARVDRHLEAIGVTGTAVHVRAVGEIARPAGASAKLKLVQARRRYAAAGAKP